jgi:hypothetical protein
MKAVIINKYGSTDELKLVELPTKSFESLLIGNMRLINYPKHTNIAKRVKLRACSGFGFWAP